MFHAIFKQPMFLINRYFPYALSITTKREMYLFLNLFFISLTFCILTLSISLLILQL